MAVEQNPAFKPFREVVDSTISEGRQLQVTLGLQQAESHFSGLVREISLAEMAARNERGVVYRMQNNYTLAEIDFTRALYLSRQMGDIDGELYALGGLIDLARTGNNDPQYKKGKNLPAALAWKNELCLSSIPENPPRLSRVSALIQCGLLEHELSEDSIALGTYNQAERECRKLIMQYPDDPNIKNRLMRIFTVRGQAYKALGMFDEASTDQQEALKHYTTLGDIRGMGNAKISLAQLAEMANNPEEAINWYARALMGSQKEAVDGGIDVIDKQINDMAIEGLKRLGSK